MAPAVLREGPYRFYFVSHDLNEPPHVHIDRDAFSTKSWLTPSGIGVQPRMSSKGVEEIGNTYFLSQEEIIGGME